MVNSQGESLTVRGFVYMDEQGRSLIASKPNLKTCCLSQERDALFLDPPLSPSTYQVVTVKGYLHTETNTLQNAQVIETSSSSGFFFLFLGLILTSLTVMRFKKIRH